MYQTEVTQTQSKQLKSLFLSKEETRRQYKVFQDTAQEPGIHQTTFILSWSGGRRWHSLFKLEIRGLHLLNFTLALLYQTIVTEGLTNGKSFIITRMGEKPAAGQSRGLQCHTLNSSDISDTKEEICFMSLSTLLSLPVFSRVVMARVAILRLESVMRFSRSRLQAVTADGCFMATCKGKDSKIIWGAITSYNSKLLVGQGLNLPPLPQVWLCSVRIAPKPTSHDCWQDAIKAQVLLSQHFKWTPLTVSYSSWVWQSQTASVAACSFEIRMLFPSHRHPIHTFCSIKYPGLCFLTAESLKVIQLQLVIALWSRNEQT